jgi:hypothetical protein
MQQLKHIAESLETNIQKLQYLHNVRWVASKVATLHTLVKDWKYAIVYLKIITEEKDKASAFAWNLLRKLVDFKFVNMLHFLLE